MKRLMIALLGVMMVVASRGISQANTATYPDFTGYVIRNGTSGSYTTSVTANDTNQTFTETAVNSGKVAIATSAVNGLPLSDFVNFKFSNSVSNVGASGIVYPNFWVTDGNPSHYALVAARCGQWAGPGRLSGVHSNGLAGGMNASYFNSLGVRVYATNTSSLNWLYPGAVEMTKGGGWAQSLWKSNNASVSDPVLVSDLSANLRFGSPFTTTTVPGAGVGGNSAWSYVGTGDPQMPQAFVLMCGDTSGSVENENYTLSNIALQSTPEPGTLALLITAGLAHWPMSGAAVEAEPRLRSEATESPAGCVPAGLFFLSREHDGRQCNYRVFPASVREL